MPFKILTERTIQRRHRWINELVKISGKFGEDTARVERELTAEIRRDGSAALFDHLHLCGTIPEEYEHDTSEEKLYSKYTDALLSAAFRQIGLTSLVLAERADAADVEAVGPNYSLVADAKVFRLSRTAKNQKDFKIEALHGWKRGKPHAMVVCPIYQLPTRTSQIYQQAIARNVCIFSYSHLAALVQFSEAVGTRKAQELLWDILRCSEHLNPTKDSVEYWTSINRTILNFDAAIRPIWQQEKLATLESIVAAKEEALTMLAREREQVMRMSRDEAIKHLVRDLNIDGREKVVRAVSDNGILAIS
ncbi:MAG: HindIII family type II restriction endonuclease [Acidobacteriaceae bacterium]